MWILRMRFVFPRASIAHARFAKPFWGHPPLELFWCRERAHPVGSTAIQFTRPEIGVRLTESRLEDAMSRGAQILLCDDPATLHELGLRNKYSLKVQCLL